PDDVDWFVAHMAEPVRVLGTVVAEPVVAIGPCRVSLDDAVRAFTGPAFTGVAS
ncbi:MAG: hypothetical protein RLZZ362_2180, partial [Actinomycetota bacterium]